MLFALCVTLAGCDFCGMSSIEGGTKRVVTTVPQGYVSSYILDVGEGKVVLIDAGGSAEATEITDALGEMGRSLSDVEAVVLTHAHSDHIAGLDALGSEGVEVDTMFSSHSAPITGQAEFEAFAAGL